MTFESYMKESTLAPGYFTQQNKHSDSQVHRLIPPSTFKKRQTIVGVTPENSWKQQVITKQQNVWWDKNN